MAYRKNTWRFPNAVEVVEYHTARYGAPGQRRIKRQNPTPEQMERQNQRNRERKARHKLRQHFVKNDYFSTLTYRREARPPDMLTAKKHWAAFIKRVRREYKKHGAEVKWLHNIEVGTKYGWHIHIIINRIPDTDIILRNAWEHGKVVSQLLYEKGEFRELAAYITKTPKTDSRLRETSYSTSRNLPIPEPEVKTYTRWKTWKEIKIPKGYYLDKESVHEGNNQVTGHPYRCYTLIKLNRRI
ncbi:MAG: hypothetical protein E7269_07760 [Lachnospiraceae bacterium]|nr:hypothetical protein [Lachnospiraceae bacterium]